jgi:hypothetical protein
MPGRRKEGQDMKTIIQFLVFAAAAVLLAFAVARVE